jgi:hypothetical protein
MTPWIHADARIISREDLGIRVNPCAAWEIDSSDASANLGGAVTIMRVGMVALAVPMAYDGQSKPCRSR